VADEEKLRILEERIVLTFTGESHFSGTNNWAMLKRFIEDAPNSRSCMRGIGEIAVEMRDALRAFDLDAFATLLDREWGYRKQLAEGVTTPQIEKMVGAAQAAGALASKIIGAGGGGCMITVVAEGVREAVEAALKGAGATLMPYKIARQGLTVTEI
jgi:D-glycero-alpha-D-manno-heptose-7-phosphate kinase